MQISNHHQQLTLVDRVRRFLQFLAYCIHTTMNTYAGTNPSQQRVATPMEVLRSIIDEYLHGKIYYKTLVGKLLKQITV